MVASKQTGDGVADAAGFVVRGRYDRQLHGGAPSGSWKMPTGQQCGKRNQGQLDNAWQGREHQRQTDDKKQSIHKISGLPRQVDL